MPPTVREIFASRSGNSAALDPISDEREGRKSGG